MPTPTSRSRWLWFGVLAGPLLWFVQLNVNYQWEEFGGCSPSATDRGVVLGIGVRAWVVLVNAVVTAVVLVALAGAVRCYRRTAVVQVGAVRTSLGGSRRPCQGDTPCPPGEHRRETAHWMALAGIFNSVLFLLLIVVGFAPAIVLKPCQTPL
jgi:hypothetical protein